MNKWFALQPNMIAPDIGMFLINHTVKTKLSRLTEGAGDRNCDIFHTNPCHRRGGVLFLVPIVIFIAVLGKAFQLTDKVAAPISAMLPQDHVGGIAVVELIALGILILICFLAGLAAKTHTARRMVHLLETNILGNIPAYALMKAKSGSILDPQDTGDMQPVLVQFDDSWQIGFEVETVGVNKCLIFLPGAPDAWSGSVCAITVDRVQPLAISIKDVSVLMKRLGKGLPDALREPLRVSSARD